MMLTLLLIGMLTLAFNVQPVEASGTIYIRADGSVEPDTAPISTVDNVTYTLTDNINSDIDGIVIERCNIILDGNGHSLQGTEAYPSEGILLSERSNITIKNMKIKAFNYGIYLYGSSNNSIFGNNITNNNHGIVLRHSSNYNSIYGNNITDNEYGGVLLWASSLNNTISGNNITNNWLGVHLEHAFYNVISENNITNSNVGIYFPSHNTGDEADNNIICGNNIRNNGIGVLLPETGYDGSSNNRFYYNNFIDNTIHADDYYASMNDWHHPVLLEGNYWSDYAGIDDGSGVGKHAIAGDGIGDTLIPHPDVNYDFYPLMEPWTPTRQVTVATVDFEPNTLNLRSRGKWITGYIELPEDYDVNDINVSTVMLNDTVPAELHPTEVGDYDGDGIPDLMVKFDRAEVISCIFANVNMTELFEERFLNITLTINGKLNDATQFQGSDAINIAISIPRGMKRHIFPL